MDFLPLDYKFQNNYEIEGYIDETEFSNVYLVSTFNKKYVFIIDIILSYARIYIINARIYIIKFYKN